MKKSLRKSFLALVTSAAAFICLPDLHASTMVFSSPPDSNFSGKPLETQAAFEIDAAQERITITLLNLQMNPVDVTQLISGLAFTVSGLDTMNANLVSSTANAVSIDKYGSVGAPAPGPTDWILQTAPAGVFPQISGAGLFLCTICGSGTTGSDPDHLIIGGPGNGGLYSNANGSIAGNKAHNPFLLGSGGPNSPQFVLSVPGVSLYSEVKNVTFAFGTTYGALQVPGEPDTPTPEPQTALLTGGVLVAAGLYMRRRSLQSKQRQS